MYTQECWETFVPVAENPKDSAAVIFTNTNSNYWQSTQVVVLRQLSIAAQNHLNFPIQLKTKPGWDYPRSGFFYIPSHSGIMPSVVDRHQGPQPVPVQDYAEQATAMPVVSSMEKIGINNRFNKRAGEEVNANNQ